MNQATKRGTPVRTTKIVKPVALRLEPADWAIMTKLVKKHGSYSKAVAFLLKKPDKIV